MSFVLNISQLRRSMWASVRVFHTLDFVDGDKGDYKILEVISIIKIFIRFIFQFTDFGSKKHTKSGITWA